MSILDLAKDISIKYLPKNISVLFYKKITLIFSKLLDQIDAQSLSGTKVGLTVKNILSNLKSKNFLEMDFWLDINSLFKLLATKDGVFKNLNYDNSFRRARDLTIKLSPNHPSDVKNIKEHDDKILLTSMEFYALDYFLFMLKELSNNVDYKKIVLNGINDMPALMDDALSDDMVNKVILNIQNEKLRDKMLYSFYEYKAVFLQEYNEEIIFSALKKYCLHLVRLLKENGFNKITHGMFFPYGQGKTLGQLEEELK